MSSNKIGPCEEYLGDGLYADWDGYQIVLAANDRPSMNPTDRVYLEPKVIEALIRYIAKIQATEVNNEVIKI